MSGWLLSEKYEVFVHVLTQRATLRETVKWGADRSAIVSIVLPRTGRVGGFNQMDGAVLVDGELAGGVHAVQVAAGVGEIAGERFGGLPPTLPTSVPAMYSFPTAATSRYRVTSGWWTRHPHCLTPASRDHGLRRRLSLATRRAERR